MTAHKIITKTVKNADLKNLNGKVVLFVNTKGRFNEKYFPLKSKALKSIKEITSSKAFKNLEIAQGITLTNWIDFTLDDCLIIKIDKNLDIEKIIKVAKLVSKFKEKSKVSILWDLEDSHEEVARILQLREYSYVEFKKDKKLLKKVGDTVFYFSNKKLTKNIQKINDSVSEGVFWCRDLVNAPANILNTKEFTDKLKALKK